MLSCLETFLVFSFQCFFPEEPFHFQSISARELRLRPNERPFVVDSKPQFLMIRQFCCGVMILRRLCHTYFKGSKLCFISEICYGHVPQYSIFEICYRHVPLYSLSDIRLDISFLPDFPFRFLFPEEINSFAAKLAFYPVFPFGVSAKIFKRGCVCTTVCTLAIRLSVRTPVCLFIRPTIHMYVHPNICPSFRNTTRPLVFLSICLSVYLFYRPSLDQFVHT